MRALELFDNRSLKAVDLPEPPPPAANEVQVRIRAVALNHIDVWGWRGMAFAKRVLPIVIGAEAAGEIVAIGSDVRGRKAGEIVALYGAETCGVCSNAAPAAQLCLNVAGVPSFHIDGLAREASTSPRLAVPAPAAWGVGATAPVTTAPSAHAVRQRQKMPDRRC
jgi:alcohol dehydrogenase